MRVFIVLVLIILLRANVFAQTPGKQYIFDLSAKFKYPNIFLVIPIFNRDNDEYAIVRNNALHKYYIKKYADKTAITYEEFLQRTLLKKVKLDLKEVDEKAILITSDMKILNDYKNGGIKLVISTYLNPVEGKLRNKVLNSNSLYNVIRIMFDNEFIISYSGYSGYYYFTK